MKSVFKIIIHVLKVLQKNFECFTSKPNTHGTFWNLHIKINYIYIYIYIYIYLKLIDQLNWNFVFSLLYCCRIHSRKIIYNNIIGKCQNSANLSSSDPQKRQFTAVFSGARWLFQNAFPPCLASEEPRKIYGSMDIALSCGAEVRAQSHAFTT